MVKCTRSTEASDFNRLRQVRSPACGSPDTSSTRSLSRTPSIDTTARLLTVVSSPSIAEASISTMFGPPCGIGTVTRRLVATFMVRRRHAERGGIRGHVMNAPIGDHDGAGNAVGRHVRQGGREGGEQPRAV